MEWNRIEWNRKGCYGRRQNRPEVNPEPPRSRRQIAAAQAAATEAQNFAAAQIAHANALVERSRQEARPRPKTQNPPPSTLNPTPYTLYPKPETLYPKLYTLHPTPWWSAASRRA